MKKSQKELDMVKKEKVSNCTTCKSKPCKCKKK